MGPAVVRDKSNSNTNSQCSNLSTNVRTLPGYSSLDKERHAEIRWTNIVGTPASKRWPESFVKCKWEANKVAQTQHSSPSAAGGWSAQDKGML